MNTAFSVPLLPVIGQFEDQLRPYLEQEFPALDISPRSRFVFRPEYVRQAMQKRKTTTIRYSPSAVEYPTCKRLPVFASNAHFECVGVAEVSAVSYKSFGQLDEADARRDGFISTKALQGALIELYGFIDAGEIVSIFHISVAPQ